MGQRCLHIPVAYISTNTIYSYTHFLSNGYSNNNENENNDNDNDKNVAYFSDDKQWTLQELCAWGSIGEREGKEW